MSDTQTINVNELSLEQLNQLSINLSLQLTQLEINKANTLNTFMAVIKLIEDRKQSQSQQQQPLNIPKLKKLNLPTINPTQTN